MNVRIYKPSKSASQSGRGKSGAWVIEPELPTARTPEALMGWTAARDTLNQLKLRFDTLDAAKAFASEKGWAFTVLPAQERKVKPRNYADNFKYIPPEDTSASGSRSSTG